MKRTWHGLSALLVLWLAGASPLAAISRADYESLLESRFFGPFSVPDEGVVFDVDVARFRLRSGEIWLQTPLSSGIVTGVVFEGDGHIELDVPDQLELRQLRRYLEDEELEVVDQPFDRLVVQTSLLGVVEQLTDLLGHPAATAQRHPLAAKRQQDWLELYGRDAAARTVAALRNLGGRYFHAEFRSQDHGWLVLEYDDHRSEELVLESFQVRGSFVSIFSKLPVPALETWLSLDRLEDRDDAGRPANRPNHGSKLLHLDAEIDLVKPGRAPRQGSGNSHSVESHMLLTGRYRALRDGVGALRLQLDPMSIVERVSRPNGTELEVVRHNTGQLDLTIDDRMHNPELVVLLDRPLLAGEEISLVFDTELELIDHAGGLHWYPTPVQTDFEEHSADLEFRHRRDTAVVSLGENLGVLEDEDGKYRTRWRIERPSSMIGFSFAQKPHSVRVEHEGLPPITLFGTTNGFLSPGRIGRLEGDVVDTLRYFYELLRLPVSAPELIVSFIESDAQAFPGFIQLSNRFLFDGGEIGSNDHGYGEHFLAHEIAHLWWGHQVGWAGYRDYWLVEALAEYSAFLYVESQLERGEKVARRILNAYTDSVTGSIRSRFDSFASWGLAFGSRSGRDRGAPLNHGRRARISESPGGAYSTIYRKGMLVLHMIRVKSRTQTGDDERFFEILREFLRRHCGGKPTARDFQLIVSEYLDGDWDAFFDQWIEGSEVPRLRWRRALDLTPEGEWQLALEVKREDVPPHFELEVPVLIEFTDGSSERQLVSVSESESRIDLRLDRQPQSVTFNEHHGVLARMRRGDRDARSLSPASGSRGGNHAPQ